jgi:hypothetical protein
LSGSTYTLDQLEALEAAIAEGALRVKYTDKEIEYRSLKEMKTIRRDMRRALGLESVPSRGGGLFGGKRIIGRHSKGLDRD